MIVLVRRLLLFAVLLATITACSPVGEQRSASPADTTPAPSRQVSDPLDAHGVAACDLLAPAALQHAGMEPGSATDTSSASATGCLWRSSDHAETLEFVLNLGMPVEVMDASVGVVPDYVAGELRGFPSVREGAIDSSICTTYVAIASTQVFSTEVSSRAESPALAACDRAELAALAALDALAARSR
ncbi:DUF3558 family protein [Pseudonocardia sp. WMMC193]|uniref:DUF3558 family protein n=1 Tax=Pseudonocardia sp. WMMC193 TaxID=2911965 RepID=UPI0035AC0E44